MIANTHTRRTALTHLGAALCAASLGPLAGCGTTKRPDPVPYREIAVIPVASPTSLYTQNRIVAIPLVPALIINGAVNRSQTARFNERMQPQLVALGPAFTTMLVEELQANGISAHVLEGLNRTPDAPDEINYSAAPTQDAVLHVWFTDVSMDSARTSTFYLPRVNVGAAFLPRRDADGLREDLVYYYGADARGDADWSIPSGEKYRYPDFDALMRRADEINESWQVALREIARRVARDLPKPEAHAAALNLPAKTTER